MCDGDCFICSENASFYDVERILDGKTMALVSVIYFVTDEDNNHEGQPKKEVATSVTDCSPEIHAECV